MKVVVAAGGRFHAIRLAEELYKNQALCKLISGSYADHDKAALPPEFVASIDSLKIIDQIIWRTRLASFIRPSTLYVFKDAWFDKRLRSTLQHLEQFDIFTGWAHYFLDSIDAIRKKTKLIITESGSCHIEEHERLIVAESARLGLPTNHLNSANRVKILQEYQASDYIMTPSAFAKESFLKKGFPEKKILKIPYGMDIDFFYKEETPHTKPADFFRLIFVGQLQISKGIHILLEAWRRLKLPPTKTELLLVGNLQRDIKLLLAKTELPEGARIVAGVSREELKKLYFSSSAFVLPSIQDGFGLVIGEAMASGLPVIASTHTGAPEIITNEHDGLLVEAGSVGALEDAIEKLYKDHAFREKIAQQGKERIKFFTWQRYGKEIISTYQSLLDNHAAKNQNSSCRQIQYR